MVYILIKCSYTTGIVCNQNKNVNKLIKILVKFYSRSKRFWEHAFGQYS